MEGDMCFGKSLNNRTGLWKFSIEALLFRLQIAMDFILRITDNRMPKLHF